MVFSQAKLRLGGIDTGARVVFADYIFAGEETFAPGLVSPAFVRSLKLFCFSGVAPGVLLR
jgi:hypothetical protein